MSRPRKPTAPASSTMVAWGWYAVTVLPEAAATGGSEAGLMLRAAQSRAFWAAWWREDPRKSADPPDPDEYGFVEGAKPIDEAVGAAYDSLRKGRGQHIYDICIGEAYARRAYREGAPVRRSKATDFDSLGRAWLASVGLGENATEAEIKAAYKQAALTAHPDKGGDAEAFDALTKGRDAAIAFVVAREEASQRAGIAAGAAPARKPRKPRARSK